MSEETRPYRLLLDETADSAQANLPAFLARPEGAPPYYGFLLIEETNIDGWRFGAITEFLEPDTPDGYESGDGFVEAPDGSRAGIVWQIGPLEVEEILPPDDRWGVWSVNFPRSIRGMADLQFNFSQVLPLLQEKYRQIKENELAKYRSGEQASIIYI